MTNALNERLKANPWEGVVVVFAMFVIGAVIWTKIFAPSRSVVGILTDSGFWFVVLLLGIPSSAIYLVTAKYAKN